MKHAHGIAVAASALLGASAIASPAVAAFGTPVAAPDAPTASTAIAASESVALASEPFVQVANVQGDFSFDQTTITTNATIKRFFASVSDALCGSAVSEGSNIDVIAIGGDVKDAYDADLKEVAHRLGAVETIMGCSCGGNVPGGSAVANVQVTGVSIFELWASAHPESGTNAVTFTCLDGTVQTYPLTWLIQHSGVVAYEINGAEIDDSFGGSNQLWIAGATAKYNLRDIVAIDFTIEDETPAAPSMENADENQPSINVRQAA